MYQSIPNLTIPRATPGIRTISLPRGRDYRPTFFAREGRNFELEKFPTDLKDKCRNFSICFKETGESWKSKCFCAVSYQVLQKTVKSIH